MADCKITPVYAGLRMLKMLYHVHLPTDIEWKTTLTMFSVNSTCRVIIYLIPMLLCELTCLKKRQLFEYVLSSHTQNSNPT